ncbi:hypothetical protein WJX84_005448 [Apatococcus fuscideae]|uniref:Uncharacterized protein n=1 Tax=Apatococcus fuscideae TaxID=2026836 RepID=A0AAW1RYS0_9CHLO
MQALTHNRCVLITERYSIYKPACLVQRTGFWRCREPSSKSTGVQWCSFRDTNRQRPQQVPKCRAAEQAADQGEGQISQQLIERMEGTLREELEADKVAVTDVYGDGRHVGIDVVSKLFEGQSSVKRQRMVYKAIWMELQDTVHAVDAMTTKTPAEVAQ